MTVLPEGPPWPKPFLKGWIGYTGNEAYQGRNSTTQGAYALSIVEFDDQGRCYSRYQLAYMEEKLSELRDKNPVIIVFAHGWKHNGASSDDNLSSFCQLLQFAVSQAGGRPVYGIFLAWRGLSFYDRSDFLTSLFTFLGRKSAALRVAMGAPRELLERVRRFRDQHEATFIVIGHSFGGLVVYNALAQSLLRGAIDPGDSSKTFANLVLLVNPAFEAVRYLLIHDVIREHFDVHDTAHRGLQAPADDPGIPCFVSVTAENDWATGWAFPIGMLRSRFLELTRGKKEKLALTRTMGHTPFMRTHVLSMNNAQGVPQPAPAPVRVRFAADNPYWVMSATPDIINGHNGIWGPAFRAWIEGLLQPHLSK